jgi:hypothetical protein
MSKRAVDQTKAAAGSKGGKQTVKRYGKRYMRRLGKWGAHRMHSTYSIEPVGTCQYALVHKETRLVKAYLSGKPVKEKS